MRVLFCVIFLQLTSLVKAQNELALATYNVLFNQKFDQEGIDVRQYRGSLQVYNATVTDFYMVPDKPAASTDSQIEIHQDTVWRVQADLDKQELFFDDWFNERVVSRWYSDSLYPMRWRISNESSVIDSLTCTRAETYYRGRKYIAWFTYSIALPFGPWKLGGLPGLIVRVQDEHQNLVISLSSFRQKKEKWSIRKFPSLTYAEYIRSGNELRKMMKLSAQQSDCIDCASKVRFFSWEKVFEE